MAYWHTMCGSFGGSSSLEGEIMRQLVKAAAIVAGMMAFSGIGFAQCKIVVIDMQDAAFADLSDALREAGTKILPIDLLERPMALLDETRALLEH